MLAKDITDSRSEVLQIPDPGRGEAGGHSFPSACRPDTHSGGGSCFRKGERDLAVAPSADDSLKYFLFSQVYIEQVFTVAMGWVGREVK